MREIEEDIEVQAQLLLEARRERRKKLEDKLETMRKTNQKTSEELMVIKNKTKQLKSHYEAIMRFYNKVRATCELRAELERIERQQGMLE